MDFRKQALGVAGGAGLFTGGLAVGRLLRLDSQRGDYRRAWEDHNLATLAHLVHAHDPFTIVVLGDSAAQGIGASKVEQCFVARFAAAVKEELGREVGLLNLSLSGGTSESVLLSQVPLIDGLDLAGRGIKPDQVVLNIGSNDVAVDDMTPEVFASRMDAICAQLPAGTLVGNIPSFGFLRSEPRAAEFSAIIGDTAAQYGHYLVDLRALTQEYNVAKYALAYHATDLFHPNSAAYANWAQLYADVWTQANELPPMTVSEAPDWEMLSIRMEEPKG